MWCTVNVSLQAHFVSAPPCSTVKATGGLLQKEAQPRSRTVSLHDRVFFFLICYIETIKFLCIFHVPSVTGLVFFETHASALLTSTAAKGSTALFWRACLASALHRTCETKYSKYLAGVGNAPLFARYNHNVFPFCGEWHNA